MGSAARFVAFAMKLRSRTVAILIALLVIAVTIYNLRGNISALSKVQVDGLHHIERARQEAQTVPFTEREHRLERRPRLEAEGGMRACCQGSHAGVHVLAELPMSAIKAIDCITVAKLLIINSIGVLCIDQAEQVEQNALKSSLQAPC